MPRQRRQEDQQEAAEGLRGAEIEIARPVNRGIEEPEQDQASDQELFSSEPALFEHAGEACERAEDCEEMGQGKEVVPAVSNEEGDHMGVDEVEDVAQLPGLVH